ncbi:hypothetical protein ACVWZV_009398 [Bradyrhizobium sp. GM5.1]|uniref:hypothetical protein n=1 Tax=Bradyrhizobium sp. 156 TaxID=2782630 RepID=UPI001FFBE6DD|nr:hypothetical protein [Bradyrhizobium sp. 156]MCK1326450.1 hypothetical protein [Bradyrhizobium sp. 156]
MRFISVAMWRRPAYTPLTAAKATFALNAGECVRRLFFVIFAPDSRQESSPLSGRKSTQATVRICGASSPYLPALLIDSGLPPPP